MAGDHNSDWRKYLCAGVIKEFDVSNHTHGPWKVKFEEGRDWQIVGNDGYHVTCIPYDEEYGRPHDDHANAFLIAAAPEMLEALRIVVGNLKAHGNATPLLFGALVKAESAIAKAEGK